MFSFSLLADVQCVCECAYVVYFVCPSFFVCSFIIIIIVRNLLCYSVYTYFEVEKKFSGSLHRNVRAYVSVSHMKVLSRAQRVFYLVFFVDHNSWVVHSDCFFFTHVSFIKATILFYVIKSRETHENVFIIHFICCMAINFGLNGNYINFKLSFGFFLVYFRSFMFTFCNVLDIVRKGY